MTITQEAIDRMVEQENKRYGKPEDRRKGRVRVTLNFITGHSLCLPRSTRVVDIKPTSIPEIFELIVESPDIPLPVDDGSLPLLDVDIKMYSMSRDRAVPLLNMCEYVTISCWKDRPDTKSATPMFAKRLTDASDAMMVSEAENEGPFDVHSPAFEALKKLRWTESNVPDSLRFSSWHEAVASLDEAQARELCATMMESFWGKIR